MGISGKARLCTCLTLGEPDENIAGSRSGRTESNAERSVRHSVPRSRFGVRPSHEDFKYL